jgi:hypothetical protein
MRQSSQEALMSSKRYEYKVLESADLAEFEHHLATVGGEGWSAVGYGVLPDGRRSALLERKQKSHDHDHHHHRHDRHRSHDHNRESAS